MTFKLELLIITLMLIASNTFANPVITGNNKVWQPIQIDFTGGPNLPQTNANPNPFTDFKLDVTFKSPTNEIFKVPGFYRGSGTWAVRFTPDVKGIWTFSTSFRSGPTVAVSDSLGLPGYCDGLTGEFNIQAADGNSTGFYKKGRLCIDTPFTFVGGNITENTTWGRDGSPYILDQTVIVSGDVTLTINGGAVVMMKPGTYVKSEAGGKVHAIGPCKFIAYDSAALEAKSYYLKTIGDGKHWIKGGTDSPEDFLAHSFTPHGGVFGMLDYLKSRNVNSVYVLLMNIGGDGDNVYPYVSKTDLTHFDLAKLETWNQTFDYAQKSGVHLQFVLNEGEYTNKIVLGANNFTLERKLFYREMIARFAYVNAITWNLCEEHDGHQLVLQPEFIRLWADYIESLDAFNHPVTVHNWAEDGWNPYYGDKRFAAISYQYRPTSETFNGKVIELKANAKSAGLEVVINIDETHFSLPYDNDTCVSPNNTWVIDCGFTAVRKQMIYPVLFAGGNIELILKGVLDLEDFSEYEPLWDYMWYARKVLEDLEFWKMVSHNELIGGISGKELCFTDNHDYAIYLPCGSNSSLAVAAGRVFTLKWYDPRTGAYVKEYTVTAGQGLDIGAPPYNNGEDWVVVLREV